MMGKTEFIHVEDNQGIAHVVLTRPEVRNAFNPQLIAELCEVFQELSRQDAVRGIVMSGTGPVFCAGMDLSWMVSTQHTTDAQRVQAAEHLMAMYQAIDECPCPVIGRIHGGAYGGGVGLVACCDVVMASEETQFALREVRVGLVPAVIAPYVLRKVGFSQTSRYCLTGEAFSAREALRIGLVHEVVQGTELDSRTQTLAKELFQGGPVAVRETKKLLRRLLELPEPEQGVLCAQTNARIRGTEEAQEGLRAFVEKRQANWVKEVEAVRAL